MDNSKNSTTRKPISLYILIPLGFILLNILIGISALTAMHLSWMLAAINGTVIGLAVVVIAFLYRQWSFTWLALIAVVGGIICSMYVVEYHDIKKREIVRNVSLAHAVNYPEAGGYYFNEGSVNTNLTGSYAKKSESTRSRSTVSFFYAAPVTGTNWSEEKPVTVWAVRGPGDNRKDWEKNWKAGIRARKLDREDFQTSINDAIKSHGLISHPQAIMVHWVSSPETSINEYLDDLWEALIIWNIVWLLGLVITRFILFLKGRKKIPDTSNKEEADTGVSIGVLYRFIFSIYCLIALEFSIYFSGMEFSSFLSITGLVLALVFYIIASVSLHIAHHKDERPLTDLLWFLVYPFLVYGLVFFSFDYTDKLFWLFPGYVYFLSIVGGFLCGVLLSPFMEVETGRNKKNVSQKVKEGFVFLKKNGKRFSGGIVLAGIMVVLVYFFLRLLSQLGELAFFQKALFCLFLFVSIWIVIRFSYRHSSTNVSQDAGLRKKYGIQDKYEKEGDS